MNTDRISRALEVLRADGHQFGYEDSCPACHAVAILEGTDG